MPQNILKLKAEEAMDYFMTQKHFINYELPEYFNFDRVLDFVKKKIGDKPYEACIDGQPETMTEVSIDFSKSKDGKYAMRPLSLPNPYLYYFLVRELCSKSGWKMVNECFDKYSVENICVCSLPVADTNEREIFHNSATVLNWWNSMEQRSLELSLEYQYMFVTDITNCYGSIELDAIAKALARKGTNETTNKNDERANNIVRLLAAMQKGKNTGIPQGSILFDFVAELVLGYSDLLLHEALLRKGVKDDFKILRYRDDYRVFCNSRTTLELISYTIQDTLAALNMHLNSQKTKITDDIVTGAVKADKLWYIKNTPVLNKKACDFDGLQKHMLYILQLGREFPNGGQVKAQLAALDQRVLDVLKPKDFSSHFITLSTGDEDEQTEAPTLVPGKIVENVRAMAAIGTQIAIENVGAFNHALRVVSHMVNSLNDAEEKWDIFEKVVNKLLKRPNSGLDQVWLQHISYQMDKKKNTCPYDVKLCQFAMGETAELWNNTWLRPSLTKGLPTNSICDQEALRTLTPVVEFDDSANTYEFEGPFYEEITL